MPLGPSNAAHYKAQDWSNKRDIDDVYFFTLTTVDDYETPVTATISLNLSVTTPATTFYTAPAKIVSFSPFHHSQSLTDRFRPQ